MARHPEHRRRLLPRCGHAPYGVMALWCALCLTGLGGCGEAEPLGGHPAAIHPAGFADDHSAALRAAGYDPGPCLACHDDGPRAPVGCRECHEDGPDACDVCHREPDAPHRAHLAFDCVTCHPVPAERATPGHLEDRPEDVRFAGAARGPGHAPSYAEGRCSDTACHAGPGARSPAPVWGGQLVGSPCGACHGLPPPAHAQGSCDDCHGPGITADGQLVDPAQHLDGRIQLLDWQALPCDGCHGGVDGAAPDLGAHRRHLAPTAAAPVACATCHVVPARNDSPGHLDDGAPGAEVIFGAAAGPDARYAAGGCADTACHGADRPTWTGDAPCGTCHGLPPADHPAGDCVRCHTTAAAGGGIAIAAQHVDGAVDVFALGAADCDRCHGEDGPVVLGGSHPTHARYACTTCHQPVADGEAPVAAHLDGDPAIRLAGYAAGRCADDACHGGGAPQWGVPETVDGCDSCHGLPPPAHSLGACDDCHPSADDPRHVDGTVDLTPPEDCGRCHGEPDSGAHRAHRAPFISAPVDCAACHPVPETVTAEGHFGPPPVEVQLVAGRYESGRCADTTCHAGPGAAVPAPAWTDEGFVCGDCHGTPPPEHLPGDCDLCHSAVAEGNVVRDPSRHADGRVDFR